MSVFFQDQEYKCNTFFQQLLLQQEFVLDGSTSQAKTKAKIQYKIQSKCNSKVYSKIKLISIYS